MIDEKKLRMMFCEVLGHDAPMVWEDGFDFRESEVDSLDMATFALRIQEVTGQRISDADLPQLRTLDALQQFLGLTD
jgi:acyl carrier protein